MQDMTIVPEGEKWKFDKDVSMVFDDMLERSIPGYNDMRDLVFKVARNFVKPETDIVDIGCSNGLSAVRFVEEYKFTNDFYLYDVSEPMLEIARDKYKGEKRVYIENVDIRKGIPNKNVSVVLSILTIQFTPIEYRKMIFQELYNALLPNGALILVEKVLGETAQLDSVLTREYYNLKRQSLYTQEQIESKRKSLEGVLVPVTANWNIDLMRSCGFRSIECFWRNLNFAGWIALKES